VSDTDLEQVARRALAARFPAPPDAADLAHTVPPPRRRRRTVLAAVAAALMVLGIAVGIAAWPTSDGHDVSGGSGAMDAAARARITGLVHRFEHAVGGGRVALVEVVASTHHRAVQATMDALVQGDEPVWVVQLTAATVFHAITTGPKGADTNPIVKYAIWILTADTFQTTDSGVGNHHADLSALGTVTSFKP
jgi:hypothetical protein